MERIPPAFVVGLIAVIGLALALALTAVRERRRTRQAQRSALHDPLTGLSNRLAFQHRLAIDWERARRYDRPLGVLFLDLDGFKAINDSRGHAAGDEILRAVGAVITERVRRADMAARLGGDEFAVLAAETPAGGLEKLATDLKADVESRLPVGVSVGWAEQLAEDEDVKEILERAHQAMYRQKQAGKVAAGLAPDGRGHEREPVAARVLAPVDGS